MLAVFSAIIPIFALIVGGNLLRRLPMFDATFWTGLNRLGFYVLYPVLLFVSIVRADFSQLSLGIVLIAVVGAWSLLGIGVWLLRPVILARGISDATYSTIFQSTVRWNGFVALAVAQDMFGTAGTATVALLMAVVVIPINIASVSVLAVCTAKEPNFQATLRKISLNPLIIGAGSALLVRLLPFPLPDPAMVTLRLLGDAALGMGLLAIGAGLVISGKAIWTAATLFPVFVKLIAFPVLMVAIAMLVGISGDALTYLALCAAVPTAMNGYVLAREMGGDAERYAAVATLQTALSFFTIPAILTIVAAISGGA